MSLRRIRITLLAAAALVAGCRPLHHRGDNEAVIIFENQALYQADVFVVGTAGDAVRIGTVFPGRTERLTIDLGTVTGSGNVNIVARILASSRAPRTGTLTLRPGDVWRVTLPMTQDLLSALPAS